jgi:hypothetical protein
MPRRLNDENDLLLNRRFACRHIVRRAHAIAGSLPTWSRVRIAPSALRARTEVRAVPRTHATRWSDASGVVIAWTGRDGEAMVKIRRESSKHVESYRDRPSSYPARSVVLAGEALVVARWSISLTIPACC